MKAVSWIKPGARFLRWRLDRQIGRGGFGSVWSAKQEAKNSEESVAIKFEAPRIAVSDSLIPKEAAILRECCKSTCFPRFIDSGVERGCAYMVMEDLGVSLRGLQDSNAGAFHVNAVGVLGVAMLKAIRFMHDLGYVHRDIKPANFVFRGQPGQGDLCLVDFGLAKRWREDDGEIIPARQNAGFRGTARYASINSHKGEDLGRRDDLWSLLYVLMELAQPPLPWSSGCDREHVGQLKIALMRRGDLTKGLPPAFANICKSIAALGYGDDPDYDGILSQLQTVIGAGDVDFGVVSSGGYSSLAILAATGSVGAQDSASLVEASFGPHGDVPAAILRDGDQAGCQCEIA